MKSIIDSFLRKYAVYNKPKPKSVKYSFVMSPIKPTHPVAVILPVYRGVDMTKRCIVAAMPNILALANSHIVVINDASPDVGMQEMLDQLAVEWPYVFILLKNENNLGFVGTVNRGLAAFPNHDVVLLNSDVIVPKQWLSRLINDAYLRNNIATVTPFSNNATICSFPNFMQENTQPFGLDVECIDAVFKHSKLPHIVAPTGVGFCMYIRRACLNQIGYLNEEEFGRGYGEENDLCQRALRNGWLNIISPNIYAYHEGGVSFSTDKKALIDRTIGLLDRLHPNYHLDVQQFIKTDPLKSARVIRHLQLLATIPIPKVVHISHHLGGGIEQHVIELMKYYEKSIASLVLIPIQGGSDIRLSFGMSTDSDSIVFNLTSEYADLLSLLKAIGVSAVHFHNIIGFDKKILQLPKDLNIAYIITVHDFYFLAANPTLTNNLGKYPGFDLKSQNNELYPLPKGISVKIWQDTIRNFIEDADCVIFPSNSTKEIFNNVYRPANTVVAPHVELELDINASVVSSIIKKAVYVIGVLGALGREKGADLLENLAIESNKIDSNFKFKLIGYSYKPLRYVEVTGAYESKYLKDLIHEHELDIIFFPAQWPETYSYTLSNALNSGLPIIAPNIGAFPERLSARRNTLLFDYLMPVSELLDQLNRFVINISNKQDVFAPIFENNISNHEFYNHDYMSIVSRDLKVLEVSEWSNTKFDSSRIKNVNPDYKNNSWRDYVVHILWRLYMSPYLRFFGRLIPQKVRRSIRVSLSTKSIHDIAIGSNWSSNK